MTEIKHIFRDTYGLVLCGGLSNRMGTDKSMLQYYNKPQRYHVYDMVIPFCEKVFISCNAQQAHTIVKSYDYIEDNPLYSNIGPMAALLTAFASHPKKNLLLIGCDYPFLTATALQGFSASCNVSAVSFFNAEADVYEPLLAWYPHTCFDELQRVHETKQFSLQHFLKVSQATKYLPPDSNYIKSIDTPEAFTETYKLINAG